MTQPLILCSQCNSPYPCRCTSFPTAGPSSHPSPASTQSIPAPQTPSGPQPASVPSQFQTPYYNPYSAAHTSYYAASAPQYLQASQSHTQFSPQPSSNPSLLGPSLPHQPAAKRKQTASAASRTAVSGIASKRPALAPAVPSEAQQPSSAHVSPSHETGPSDISAPSVSSVSPTPPHLRSIPPSSVSSTSPSPSFIHIATVCGVGPSMSSSLPTPPTATVTSTPSPTVVITSPGKTRTGTNTESRLQSTVPFPTRQSRAPGRETANDVYYFMRALTSNREIELLPPAQEKRLHAKPNTQYLGCRLCSELPEPKWRTWRNGSITETLRNHFRNYHGPIWTKTCEEQQLKGHGVTSQVTSDKAKQVIGQSAFSLETVRRRLVEWIVADDQSLRAVDVPEFRCLMLAVGMGNLIDSDIPHRTFLTKLIATRHRTEEQGMKLGFTRALGRLSFTMDMWSDESRRSFMAVTVHFCTLDNEGKLHLETELLAFRHVTTDHTGASIAKIFHDILVEFGVSGNVGQISLDNAKNNDTFMRNLSSMIDPTGRHFSPDGNRIR